MQAMADTLGALHSCVFHGSVGWLGFQIMIASTWCKEFLALLIGLCTHDPVVTNSGSFAANMASFLFILVVDKVLHSFLMVVNLRFDTVQEQL